MSDWDDVLRIARTSDQMLNAMRSKKPFLRKHRLFQHDIWYDLRGEVDEIPGLGVVFSTSAGLRAGVQIPPPGYPFSHLILLPQFFRESWNMTLYESQSLVHHEIAHILLGHEQDVEFYGNFTRMTSEYFNHPYEIEAFMHQSLAALAMKPDIGQYSWTSGPMTEMEILGGNASDFV